VGEIHPWLADITPRAASVTLLLFDRVVARYEREKGRALGPREREAVLTLLRAIAAREVKA
jgi:hypothetical protein